MNLSLLSVALCALLLCVAAQTNQDDCNFGPTHHSHLVIPLQHTQSDCEKPGAKFFLSHGATFFCPHTYDVKLIAEFGDNSQQQILCQEYFAALAAGQSAKFSFRPDLPQNGLPATGAGLMTEWTSPVLYHVWNFGTNSSAGPGNGWNTTTIIDDDILVTNMQAIYFREFDISTPRPNFLSYLLYMFTDDGSNDPSAVSTVILTHYITSAPDFDHILFISMEAIPANLPRINGWPLRLDVPGRADNYENRLRQDEVTTARIHSNDPATGLPTTFDVKIRVTQDLYSGIDDGFADFGFNCPFPPPHPQSRGLCTGKFS